MRRYAAVPLSSGQVARTKPPRTPLTGNRLPCTSLACSTGRSSGGRNTRVRSWPARGAQTAAAAGKSVGPATASAPACTDPGPFAYAPPKPAEAAGAHSPPETAKAPPSSQAPAGAATPAKK